MQTELRVDTPASYIFAMTALYKLLRMKLLFRLAARTTTNGDWTLHYYSLHNDISRIPAPVGKPNVGWCFILTATPPGIDSHPLCYTRSGGPALRLADSKPGLPGLSEISAGTSLCPG